MADEAPPPLPSRADMISTLMAAWVDMVQRVGFPIVMVFILTYVIWVQNQTLTKVNIQQAANATAFQIRMDALEKNLDEIKESLKDCNKGGK